MLDALKQNTDVRYMVYAANADANRAEVFMTLYKVTSWHDIWDKLDAAGCQGIVNDTHGMGNMSTEASIAHIIKTAQIQGGEFGVHGHLDAADNALLEKAKAAAKSDIEKDKEEHERKMAMARQASMLGAGDENDDGEEEAAAGGMCCDGDGASSLLLGESASEGTAVQQPMAVAPVEDVAGAAAVLQGEGEDASKAEIRRLEALLEVRAKQLDDAKMENTRLMLESFRAYEHAEEIRRLRTDNTETMRKVNAANAALSLLREGNTLLVQQRDALVAMEHERVLRADASAAELEHLRNTCAQQKAKIDGLCIEKGTDSFTYSFNKEAKINRLCSDLRTERRKVKDLDRQLQTKRDNITQLKADVQRLTENLERERDEVYHLRNTITNVNEELRHWRTMYKTCLKHTKEDKKRRVEAEYKFEELKAKVHSENSAKGGNATKLSRPFHKRLDEEQRRQLAMQAEQQRVSTDNNLRGKALIYYLKVYVGKQVQEEGSPLQIYDDNMDVSDDAFKDTLNQAASLLFGDSAPTFSDGHRIMEHVEAYTIAGVVHNPLTKMWRFNRADIAASPRLNG